MQSFLGLLFLSLLSSASAFAYGSTVNRNDEKHCCSSPTGGCTDSNGVALAPCAAVSTADAPRARETAPTSNSAGPANTVNKATN